MVRRFCWVAAVAMVWAQETREEWEKLNSAVVRLYGEGKYRETAALGEKALELAERTFGHEHPYTATSLHNLAELYWTEVANGKSTWPTVRALAILQKSLGLEHPDTEISYELSWRAERVAYGKAVALYMRALAIREKALGPDHPETGTTLNKLAAVYMSQHESREEYRKAGLLYVRLLAIREKTLGPEHAETGTTLNDLAAVYQRQRAYEKAEPLYVRLLAIREKTLGPEHAETGTTLNDLAAVYQRQRAYEKAEPLYVRALAICETTLGPEHADTWTLLSDLAAVYESQGVYGKAEPLYVRLLAIREKGLGRKYADTSALLSDLAAVYQQQRAYEKAEPLYVRALAIREKTLGAEHADTGTLLNNLAGMYESQSAYEKAEPLYVRLLAIREKTLGPEHPETGTTLNNLAGVYESQRAYEKAEPLFVRLLAIREKTLGPEHPETGNTLMDLADVYRSQREYGKAEPLYLRVLAIREKTLGPEHPGTGTMLKHLAEVYKRQGAYGKAEPLYVRALALHDKGLGSEYADVWGLLNDMAVVYESQGAYGKAEPLYVRALALKEKLGLEHPDTGVSLNSLAALYRSQREYGKAEPLYLRVLAISEKALGPEHPDTRLSLNNLAALYESQGAYGKAEPLYLRALAISEALGPAHPDIGTSLNNLAFLYESQGAYSRAEDFYLRALAIFEKAFGPEHPETGTTLSSLARLQSETGDYPRAIPLYVRAIAIREKALAEWHPDTLASRQNLLVTLALQTEASTTGSEKNLVLVRKHFPKLLSGHAAALRTGLSEGSRMVRTGAAQGFRTTHAVAVGLARKLPDFRADALQGAADAALNGRGRLTQESQEAISAMRRRMDPATRNLLDQLQETVAKIVQRARSSSAAAAELEELYARHGWIETELIAKSQQYRDATRVPTMDELARSLAGRRACAVEFEALPDVFDRKSPDHAYALIVTEAGVADVVDLGLASDVRKLAERYWRTMAVADNGPFVAADGRALADVLLMGLRAHLGNCKRLFVSPDAALARVPFDLLPWDRGATTTLGERFQVSLIGSLREVVKMGTREASHTDPVGIFGPDYGPATDDTAPPRFSRLEASTKEEQSVVALHVRGLQPFTGKDARKGMVLQREFSPRILHVASHAFFEPAGGDPLLASGIAMAGANGGAGGILTGYEVAGMSLRGCQLVVLSACETGLGGGTYGDGLLGMQRSLTLARAQSAVLSLWRVPTGATVRLMDEFYKRAMVAGTDKADALRAAKEVLRGEGRSASEWAGWVLYGDPGPLYE